MTAFTRPAQGDRLRPRQVVRALRHADLATLRAAIWAGRALREVRGALPSDGLDVVVRPPPELPQHAVRGIKAVVWLSRATCLERSLLLQRWLAAHGAPHPLVVGTSIAKGFEAHAWVRGVDEEPDGYEVLTTVHPAGSSRSSPKSGRSGYTGHLHG